MNFCLFFFFFPVCQPVGVADINTIPDAKMAASTIFSTGYHPYYGRLNGKRGQGAWCPRFKDRSEYLQVDMGAVRYVCAVQTQEGTEGQRTTSYKLRVSLNGVSWDIYKENNADKVSLVTKR